MVSRPSTVLSWPVPGSIRWSSVKFLFLLGSLLALFLNVFFDFESCFEVTISLSLRCFFFSSPLIYYFTLLALTPNHFPSPGDHIDLRTFSSGTPERRAWYSPSQSFLTPVLSSPPPSQTWGNFSVVLPHILRRRTYPLLVQIPLRLSLLTSPVMFYFGSTSSSPPLPKT